MGVILDFVSLLRYLGFPISPDETITAQKTYQTLGVQQKNRLQIGLKAAIVKKREDFHIFDVAFESFFYRQQSLSIDPPTDSFKRAKNRFIERLEGKNYQEIGELLLENQIDSATQKAEKMIQEAATSSGQSKVSGFIDLQKNLQRTFQLAFGVRVPIRELTPSQRQDLPSKTIQIGTNLQLLEQSLIRRLQNQIRDDSSELERIQQENPAKISSIDSFLHNDLSYLSISIANVKEQLIEMGRILASRERKRRKRAKYGKLDFRRTFRKNLTNNGVPIELVQKRKRIQDPEIIILNDVSGSTRWVADWFFVITFAARSVFKKVRIFEFDNTMVEVTSALERLKTIDRALEERKLCWKKTLRPRRIHSDYQTSLEDFFLLTQYRPVSRRTTIIILGDCRDNEGMWIATRPISAVLLEKLILSAKRVVILNPERESLWNTGDSVVQHYKTIGANVHHMATLYDLVKFVFELRHN
ncbi:MAG: VWA domain-containing protein [Candidatus Thorarchaeota archaeon]